MNQNCSGSVKNGKKSRGTKGIFFVLSIQSGTKYGRGDFVWKFYLEERVLNGECSMDCVVSCVWVKKPERGFQTFGGVDTRLIFRLGERKTSPATMCIESTI